VGKLHSGHIPHHVQNSRYGEVIQIEEPMTITYTHPKERVLFNSARDCNPFFHLYEALWMLAGRNDVAPLVYYASRMKEFSDDGKTFNGAYGYRWKGQNNHYFLEEDDGKAYTGRGGFGQFDQLRYLIAHLKEKPESRRAVLQMWSIENDLFNIDISKDVCCNLSACFLVRQGLCTLCKGTGRGPEKQGSFKSVESSYACPKCLGKPHDQPQFLDMTVFNRSNDMIWGMLGANAVHFSILQEYMADKLELEVGVYNQISNNLHVYTNNWRPEEWLKEYKCPEEGYGYGFKPSPLCAQLESFDKELPEFVEANSEDHKWLATRGSDPEWLFSNRFLSGTAASMMQAFHCHKMRKYDIAKMWLEQIEAQDWKLAATQWIEKRKANYEKKMHEPTGEARDNVEFYARREPGFPCVQIEGVDGYFNTQREALKAKDKLLAERRKDGGTRADNIKDRSPGK
jgi:thymidylate synthase